MAAAILQHESRPLKKRCFGRSRSLPGPFYFNFFSAKVICTINLTVSFYLYLYLKPREKIEMILYFVSLAAWLSFQHGEQLTAGGESRGRSLAIECVSVFPFSPSSRFSVFSRSNAHTHTNKEGAKTRGKAERRQRAVRFTRFLDYRLMFDSERSFSLKYDLICPPY